MIVTEFYKGQGLGNQLFVYIMTRVIALDNGYDFGILHPEKFKGSSIFKLDFGRDVQGGLIPYEGAAPEKLPNGIKYYFREERLNHSNGADIRTYDPKIKEIKDNTKIDGLFQGEDYFIHRKNEIRKWLQIQPIELPENLCIINFRGGEYVGTNDFFLPNSYWQNSIQYIKSRVPNIRFKIVTDDTRTARKFFPEYEISHDLSNDYKSIQSAHYLILSNSSFAILPTWLNEKVKIIVAPKYWARHNISDGYWSLSYNMMKGWNYMGRDGKIYNYEDCLKERDSYMQKEKDTFWEGEPPAHKITIIQKIKNLIPRSIKNILKGY